MQRNSVISLQPALGTWRTLRELTGADPGAVYGCVDWYLYQETTLAGCASRSSRGEPARLIEAGSRGGAAVADTGAHPGI